MKRLAWIVCVCVTCLPIAGYHAWGKETSKKKPKPPQTLIAKCGELVLQDDFDRDDPTPWTTDSGGLSCSDGKLILDARDMDQVYATTPFAHSDFVAEIMLRCPQGFAFGLNQQGPHTNANFSANASGVLLLQAGSVPTPEGAAPTLASKEYGQPINKPTCFVFEKAGNQILLRAGKFVLPAKGEGLPDGQGKLLRLFATCRRGSILEIDYIYIWSAEPKKRKQ
ncbi:MAG: hypothetical protein AB1696_20345 [Planctomycetota bacterium]